MKDPEFRMLLDLAMVSDPWPLTDEQSAIMEGLLSRESKHRCFEDWIQAYHQFDLPVHAKEGGRP